MNEDIKFAGDINVERVNLIGSMYANENTFAGRDIRPQLLKIEIFESLFSSFTTARLYLHDASDLINTVPIRGEEVVNITAFTPTIKEQSKKLDFAFHVHSLSDRNQSSDRSNVYVLDCISAEAFVNANRKISRAFSGTVSEIATNIFKDTGYGLSSKKNLIVEDTSNSIHYVSNYWTPLKNFTFLCENAISLDGYASYVFFENRSGFNFFPLEKLYLASPVQKFVKDNRADGSKQNLDEKYSRIEKIEIHNMFEYYVNSDEGVYGSVLNNYDLVTKKYKQIQYFNSEDKARIKLNQNQPYSSSLIQSPFNAVYDRVSQYKMFDDVADVSNTSIIQKRKSRLNIANLHSVKIQVPGRSDYTVGSTVELLIPKDSTISPTNPSQQVYDPLLSGKYIIAEVTHTINGSAHSVTMNLIKDSLGNLK